MFALGNIRPDLAGRISRFVDRALQLVAADAEALRPVTDFMIFGQTAPVAVG